MDYKWLYILLLHVLF